MHRTDTATTPSTAVVWNDSLATGLQDVDAQHQKLFEIAHRVGELRNNGSAEQITAVLKDLQDYIVYHFGTEEALMALHPVSEAHRKTHIRAHQGFLKQIMRASELAVVNPVATADLLLAFLAQWLLHHIANMDRRLADEIQASTAGTKRTHKTARENPRIDTLIENINQVYADLGDRTFGMLELNLQLQDEIEMRRQAERNLEESKARFRMMADYTHSWEYWQGAGGGIHYMSPSCMRVTGYAPNEFAEDPDLLYRIIHPDDRHLMDRHRHDHAAHELDEEEIGFRIVHKDGDIRWIIHSCKAMYSTAGEFIGRRGSNRDITERQLRNDSMLLMVTVFESINEAVLVTDADNRIIVVNTSFSTITGYTPEEVIGRDPGVLADEVPPPDLVWSHWKKLTATGRWQGEMINRRKSGELYAAAVSIDCVRDDHGDISNFVMVFSDISDRKESERRIHYLAHHDPLTGLLNWTLFSERAQLAMQAVAQNGRHAALMFVDIDRFKQAKDRIGHENGDLLLKEFAERLQSCLSGGDTAARIGSDEFVVLLPDVESAQQAVAVAEHIKQAVSQPFLPGGHDVRICVSVGIALYPEHGDDAGQILKNADLAMYQAKQAGGATVSIYNPADW